MIIKSTVSSMLIIVRLNIFLLFLLLIKKNKNLNYKVKDEL